jgi:hypothetical protein
MYLCVLYAHNIKHNMVPFSQILIWYMSDQHCSTIDYHCSTFGYRTNQINKLQDIQNLRFENINLNFRSKDTQKLW